jgi:hypothetical protein
VASHQHDDFNPLLDTLIRFAKKCLEERGAFLPFAATMSADGEVSHVAGHSGEERPGAPKVLQFLEGTLRAMVRKNGLRAAGICVDIRFAASLDEPKTDAIQVFLEHREGNVVDLLLPYRRVAPGQVSYGKLMAVRAEPKLFVNLQ